MASYKIDMDKIAGMLLAGAVGDALGAPSEFAYNRKEMPYTGWIQYRPRLNIRYQGYKYAMLGQPTDDTEMTLALWRSVIAEQTYKPEAVIAAYLRWAYAQTYTFEIDNQVKTVKSRSFGMGINTRKLLANIKQISTYMRRYEQKFGQKPIINLAEAQSYYQNTKEQAANIFNNQANGSLMRMSSLALLPDNIREAATILDCQLTNPSLVNIDCSLYAVRVLRKLLLNVDKTTALNHANSFVYHTANMRDVVLQAFNKTPRDVSKETGWILHSLYLAIRALNEFDYYNLAIDWIIAQLGDTDTNAAIAGNWLGAWKGYNALKDEEPKYPHLGMTRNTYNMLQVIKCNTLTGDYPRPPEYRLADWLDMLAASQQLANA